MQEIAQGYVSFAFHRGPPDKDFDLGVNISRTFNLWVSLCNHFDELSRVESVAHARPLHRLANSLMRSCHASTLNLWKRRLASGGKSTRHVNDLGPSLAQFRLIVSLSSQALQLLEYLVKHGSERVVDDARSHVSTLKMLRSFHYIDEKGKDQGINGKRFHPETPSELYISLVVRNRSKELVEILADVDKIRQERKKAKANKTKYVGSGNDGFSSFGGGRYGGFGNDSGSYSGDYGTSASGYERGGLLGRFLTRWAPISESRLLGR
jgi:hypothetical protein